MRSRMKQTGFTLIEMLTVIVIIGILSSLITGAAIRVRVKARETIIGIELNQLDLALRTYKQKHGRYPPDFAAINTPQGRAAVLRHLSTAFPRYVPGIPSDSLETDPWEKLKDDLDLSGLPTDMFDKLDPSSALVFWLGGLPDGPGSRRLIGFSANPRNPFDDSARRTAPLFKFDARRLKVVAGVLKYYPATGLGTNKQTSPYVYLKSRNGGYEGKYWEGRVFPFRDTDTGDWVNPRTFQILSAGLDDKFGTTVPTYNEPPEYPAGTNYGDDQFDNITNFSGGTIEDKM